MIRLALRIWFKRRAETVQHRAMMNYHTVLSICITGASSGVGAALGRAFAKRGHRLFLLGRDKARLSETRAGCEALGAESVVTQTVDVTQRDQMEKALTGFDVESPIDILIANAGISGGTGDGGEAADQAFQIFDVNLTGVLNTVAPILPKMIARRRGQIALMSSLAAYRGFAGAPAYSASKAAVKTYAEALRGAHHKDGVLVSAICPGFIRSPMTDVNPFPMPFMIEADDAAERIVKGLEKNKPVVAFPLPMHWGVSFFSLLPPRLAGLLLRRLPEKH